MKSGKIVIVGNGILDESLFMLLKDSYIVACDRAAYILLRKGILSDVAIGDFDSVTHAEFEEIKQSIKTVEKFSPEKDETDLELAINFAIKLNPLNVVILGATGGRLDHELTHIFLLKKFLEQGISASIIDANNKITLIDKITILCKDKTYRYISIIPYADGATVSMKGFKYETSHVVFKKTKSLGISNEIVGKSGEIDIVEGSVILVQSRD